MIRHIMLFYSNHIKRYLFPHKEEANGSGKNLHYTKIRLAGQDINNIELPLEERVVAVHHIGLLGYTGGYTAAVYAAGYMPVMADLLKQPSLSDHQRTAVLEGLSGLCYVHLANQRSAQTLGIHATLQELIDPACPLALSIKVQMWSGYLINILCWNNIPLIRILARSDGLRQSLECLESHDWFGWPKNYARELLYILGFWEPQTLKRADSRSPAGELCLQSDSH
uniref:Uncharacterized protein n=1 Tax=Esox lucius TaxID=8010 RepID=A0AAY5KJA2_ESOLU